MAVIGMDELRELGRELSNWGRWGDSDERGALNLITPQRVAEAAAEVRRGVSFRLSMPVDETGLFDQRATGRFNPIRKMIGYRGDNARGDYVEDVRFAEDMLIIGNHMATHVDALSHAWYDDRIYNGYEAATSVTRWGAHRCAIDTLADGVMSRGLLLDLPRHRGMSCLLPGTRIGPAELEAVAVTENVEPRPGDILLVRTGTYPRQRRGLDVGPGEQPGLTWECARWLREHDIAAVCADNQAVEVVRANGDGPLLPFHMLVLRDMGVLLGELFDFEDLAAACAADGVYSCMFFASPLNMPGGTGSPVNPVAVK
ncbi:MAG TPA: cyclase family protein [Amycolatopsis sp.]|uniref:cyclase family protein n=1 Tax=Amycolatopsis sp. TaxID=37632 RepID=UPI002B499C58|nr:cyclase family protein [Amycolatopsis sp.]HKS46999.1 cyclase family protein [Amycolatopsis sp.]